MNNAIESLIYSLEYEMYLMTFDEFQKKVLEICERCVTAIACVKDSAAQSQLNRHLEMTFQLMAKKEMALVASYLIHQMVPFIKQY